MKLTDRGDEEQDQSSGYASMEQPPVEGLDELDISSVTTAVFSSDSDDDVLLLSNNEPAILPPLHSTPARQLSDIPEMDSPNTSLHLSPTNNETSPSDADNLPSSLPPTSQPESDPSNNSSSASNLLLYTTTAVLAVYNKLND